MTLRLGVDDRAVTRRALAPETAGVGEVCAWRAGKWLRETAGTRGPEGRRNAILIVSCDDQNRFSEVEWEEKMRETDQIIPSLHDVAQAAQDTHGPSQGEICIRAFANSDVFQALEGGKEA